MLEVLYWLYVERTLFYFAVCVSEVMMRVEDVIIKTILCGEVPIVAACKTYQSHRGNCFGKAKQKPILSLSLSLYHFI